jgi:hypothetical protein
MKRQLVSGFSLTFLLTVFTVNSLTVTCQPAKGPAVRFVVNESEKRVDVIIDGKNVTSLCWPDNVYKPVLYPMRTLSGTEITRGFPLNPRAGERNDHIHQVGSWLNYGNVNGFDFWGNGSTGKKSEKGGVIRFLGIEKAGSGDKEGLLSINAVWEDPSGKEMMKELTDYRFSFSNSYWIVDRITTLTAGQEDIRMPDTKEGMFAIRVARQLELPSKENVPLLDSNGKPGTEKAMENRGVTGNYRSSEGRTGEAVWGTRARWMDLYGTIGNEKISIVICDHPDNPSYPTFWHARGYGLFSANPLGAKDFTDGRETVNFSIPSGKSVIFRYRTIISSGSYLTDDEINKLADEFAVRY